VEHALSKSSRIAVAAACTDNITDMVHYYFTKTATYNQMFAVMDYNFTTAILTLISNFIATFTWNFTDLFIILVSLALGERFHLFNQYLVSLRGKVINHFVHLVTFMKKQVQF
jgi:gustatory receptor